MRSRIATWLMIVAIGMGLTSFSSDQAQAASRNVNSVIRAGSYGLLVGTLVGAASFPFNRDVKRVFIGSSVGLYVGIVAGIAYVATRDGKSPPRRYSLIEQSGQQFGEQPALFGQGNPYARTLYPPLLELNVPVLRF